jgi:hypothetical protein
MNNDTQNTLRGSFVNDVNTYLYNTPIATDFIRLSVGATELETEIAYMTAKYIQLEFTDSLAQDGRFVLNYDTASNTNMLSSYTGSDGSTQFVKITLPANAVKYEGLYTLTLHNTRTQQRQSISQALRPQADN